MKNKKSCNSRSAFNLRRQRLARPYVTGSKNLSKIHHHNNDGFNASFVTFCSDTIHSAAGFQIHTEMLRIIVPPPDICWGLGRPSPGQIRIGGTGSSFKNILCVSSCTFPFLKTSNYKFAESSERPTVLDSHTEVQNLFNDQSKTL